MQAETVVSVSIGVIVRFKRFIQHILLFNFLGFEARSSRSDRKDAGQFRERPDFGI